MQPIERYLAVDNVCAWPQLTRLPDRSIGAILFNQPSHGECEGTIECWVSQDDGRHWRRAGTPVPNAPTTNRMNHASGLAGDGSYLVIVSGYDNRPPAGQPAEGFSKATILDPVVAHSHDSGKTWRIIATLPRGDDGRALIPFGPILKRADGLLLASFYTHHPSPPDGKPVREAVTYRSADQGVTWQFHATIASGDYNETCIHAVDDRRYLAAARTFTDQTMHLYISDDAGDSWRFSGQATGAYEHNAHLLNLPDGRVLMTYGIRHPGGLGLGCKVSPDKGTTWRRPHVLFAIDDVAHYDAGYPSCVQVGDDSILTAYYTCRSPWHQRYHMGVLIWNWKEMFKRGFDQ